jgi:hypothetical protein
VTFAGKDTEGPLCLCQQERVSHLLAQRNFTEAFWNLTANRYGLPSYSVLSIKGGLIDWTIFLLASGNKKERSRKLGILFAF